MRKMLRGQATGGMRSPRRHGENVGGDLVSPAPWAWALPNPHCATLGKFLPPFQFLKQNGSLRPITRQVPASAGTERMSRLHANHRDRECPRLRCDLPEDRPTAPTLLPAARPTAGARLK